MTVNHPIAILEEKYHKDVEVVDVYVSTILDKKETTKIVKFLSAVYPLSSLTHLKRVRATQTKDKHLQVIVSSEENDFNDVSELVSQSNDLKSLKGLFKLKVPKCAPLTRKQYEESCLFWPLSFHEDKKIEQLLNKNYFDDAEISLIQKYMKEAFEFSTLTPKDIEVTSYEGIMPRNGALIVDPVTQTVLAKSCDLRNGGHPLQHAVMMCIDLVARSQGGGMWDPPNDCTYFKPLNESKTDEAESILDPESAPIKSGPYLCTGYDLYVTKEPCVMCAMALVHARIQRVFYHEADAENGALGSVYKIHTQNGLNHHYQVFCNILS